ncbi:MAG: adenylate/guanylate cyclase domain-containing protein [Burkholderiaceae bacterium]
MIADVAGYSRMMERDEEGTHARMREIRAQVTDPAIRRHGGRIVRTAGDGMLVEFASAVEALSCAVEIQREMAARNRGLAPDSRVDFRIGINIGDIIIDGADIAGDGVNLAARLEALAEPGGIALSRAVREQVRQVVGVTLNDAGRHRVKNISKPIQVYTVALDGHPRPGARFRRWTARWAAGTALTAALGAAAALLWTHFAPRAEAPRQSLAVLPFGNLSQQAEGEAIAARLTIELTTALSRVAGMHVIARTAAARYVGPEVDVAAAGRALNVRYAVEGTVLAAGERVRAAAHLVRTDNGAQLWSETFDVARGGDEPVPLELVGRLADTLRTQVRTAELKRLGDGAPDAFALALRARMQMPHTETVEQIREVARLYEQALRLDAEHVPALAGLAYAHAVLADRVHDPSERAALLRRAEELSARAVALDANDAESWGIRSAVLQHAHNFDAAFEAAERGLRLNPYDSELHGQRGLLLIHAGRAEEALASIDRAIHLNPVSDAVGVHLNMRCRALLYLGRYAEAIDACQRATTSAADWPDYMLLTAAYAMSGDMARAAQARAELLRREPRFSIRWVRALSGEPAPRAAQQREQHLFAGLRKAGIPD